MIFLKIILLTVGVAFIVFGYKIYFQKKYNLINGFAEAKEKGMKSECYAKNVGLIEFVLGLLFTLIAICIIVIK